MTGQGIINNSCPPPETWFGSPSMSWVNPAFVLKDLIKTAEKIVEEDKKIEFAQAEAVRLAVELKAKQEEQQLRLARDAAIKKAIVGKPCNKARQKRVYAGAKFTCVKSAKKLVWKRTY